jgi:uncharacterized protein (DUF2237 family)
MKWTDINDLAIELAEAHPEVDPLKINFVDLMNWVARLARLRRRYQALRRENPRGDPAGLDRRTGMKPDDSGGSQRNVLGGLLGACSERPMTGFFRDGCCNTSDEDVGSHTICVVLTADFLAFSKAAATTCRRRARNSDSPACSPATAGASVPPAGAKPCKPARRHRSSSTPPTKPRC